MTTSSSMRVKRALLCPLAARVQSDENSPVRQEVSVNVSTGGRASELLCVFVRGKCFISCFLLFWTNFINSGQNAVVNNYL